MDEFKMTMFMVLGILLRIGIPLGLTFLLARFLRRLDAKWRAEASEVHPGEAIMFELWLKNPCWDEFDCTKEQCENCAAYNQKEKPCWEVFRVNGHDLGEITNAFAEAGKVKQKPSILIAKTVKGKGVSFFEGKVKYHGVAPSNDELAEALAELKA